MPRETTRYNLLAINQYGAQISMKIVERDGVLMLWNGLAQHSLSLPAQWTWQDMESEVKRLSGVTRVVMV